MVSQARALHIRTPRYGVLTPLATGPSLGGGKRKLTDARFFAALQRFRQTIRRLGLLEAMTLQMVLGVMGCAAREFTP